MGNDQIAANAVTSTKIAAGAVGTTQIDAGAVGSTQVHGAVGTTQIDAGAIGSTSAAGAVDTAKIADNAVTSTKIAAGAVGTTQIATNITQMYFAGSEDADTLASNGTDYSFKLDSFTDVLTQYDSETAVQLDVVNTTLNGNTSIIIEDDTNSSLTVESGVLTAFTSKNATGDNTNITASTTAIELTQGDLVNVNSQFDATSGKTQGLSYVRDVNLIVPTQANDIAVNNQIKIFSEGSALEDRYNGPANNVGGTNQIGEAEGFGISNTIVSAGTTLTTNIDLGLQYETTTDAATIQIDQITAPVTNQAGKLSTRTEVNDILYYDTASTDYLGSATIKVLNPHAVGGDDTGVIGSISMIHR